MVRTRSTSSTCRRARTSHDGGLHGFSKAQFSIRYATPPTNSTADLTATDLFDKQQELLIAGAQGGAYFILLQGREGAGSGTRSRSRRTWCRSRSTPSPLVRRQRRPGHRHSFRLSVHAADRSEPARQQRRRARPRW